MSAATVLLVVGLLVAAAGAGLAVRAYVRPAADAASVPDDVLVAEAFAQLADTVRQLDARLRIGVAVAVAGLVVAGIGAYLGSDARALGADVGGAGTSDKARVGGTW